MEEPVYIRNMRELRKQAHYTQEEVSEKLNIQRQTYSNYENEWRQPPLDIIIRLAELYHVSTDYLLLGSEPGKQAGVSNGTSTEASSRLRSEADHIYITENATPCIKAKEVSAPESRSDVDILPESDSDIPFRNISGNNPVTCCHLNETICNLLKEFYSLSEEEQTVARNIIQSSKPYSVHSDCD